MVEHQEVGAGLFETDYGPEGYVPLVGLDRFGEVEMNATVAAGLHEWLTARGHVATISDWVKEYDAEINGPQIKLIA